MALTLDGHAHGSWSSGTNGTVTLTTSDTNDIIVVVVSAETADGSTPTVSSVTASGLTFTKRHNWSLNNNVSQANQIILVEEWWALSTGALSSKVITATFSGAIDDAVILAFGVNGANTTTPFDVHTGLPVEFSSTSTSANAIVNVSTTAANTFIFGVLAASNIPSEIPPYDDFVSPVNNGIDQLANGGATYEIAASAVYDVVSTAQTSLPVGTGTTVVFANGGVILFADAIQAASGAASTDGLLPWFAAGGLA